MTQPTQQQMQDALNAMRQQRDAAHDKSVDLYVALQAALRDIAALKAKKPRTRKPPTPPEQ